MLLEPRSSPSRHFDVASNQAHDSDALQLFFSFMPLHLFKHVEPDQAQVKDLLQMFFSAMLPHLTSLSPTRPLRVHVVETVTPKNVLFSHLLFCSSSTVGSVILSLGNVIRPVALLTASWTALLWQVDVVLSHTHPLAEKLHRPKTLLLILSQLTRHLISLGFFPLIWHPDAALVFAKASGNFSFKKGSTWNLSPPD